MRKQNDCSKKSINYHIFNNCIRLCFNVEIIEMKIAINNERVGIIFLKGGYKAFWIRYSNGKTITNKGKWKNLWCFPKLEYKHI